MRVVLDTNVIFEGLTKQAGACGLIIEAWRADLMTVCVSNAIGFEYEDVLSRKLSEKRWHELRPILNGLLRRHVRFIEIYFSWRPTSPDPGADHIIDCAANASAIIVTSNLKDFAQAKSKLGLKVLTPNELVRFLINPSFFDVARYN